MSAKADQFQKPMYEALKQYWGYTSFRALQEDVILSILGEKESLTVMPTGGGKSLCFQLPALLKEGMAVVISPLISLMKDQVDDLKAKGIAASCLNSSLTPKEQMTEISLIRKGKVKILYISPERLQQKSTISLLTLVNPAFFVIDEAHCISHWGHDFREDYRKLKFIKERFKSSCVHAFTATATVAVQQDILEQLQLNNPEIHIRQIDRPNLSYRVIPRSNLIKQITDVLEKHPDEPGIIYCLRRKDVENISEKLNTLGFKNVPYHAGLSDTTRHMNQDKFIREEVDIIVATIAFGMGIDRSNIRFIIHAAMPKSIEHYHQETGRAGRDGLNSHCYMFFGGGDYRVMRSFIETSPHEKVMMDKLNILYNFCSRPHCRHRFLVNYFGQDYDKPSCQACDYCLNELEMVEESLVTAQKIISCVVRVSRGKSFGFGASCVADVLKGKTTDQVNRMNHQLLSTFGIMAESSITFIRYMIEQLVGQGFLRRDEEFSTLSLTSSGKQVLKGEMVPLLTKPLVAAKKKQVAAKRKQKREKDWEGVNKELFRSLREKRSEMAHDEGVPAYIIFGDKSLRDMALIKPVTKEAFAKIFGVGEKKLESYADEFIEIIRKYIANNQAAAG